jgi:hypothetical protein
MWKYKEKKCPRTQKKKQRKEKKKINVGGHVIINIENL